MDSIIVLFSELANDSESEMTFSRALIFSRYLSMFAAKFSAIFERDLSKVSTMAWRNSFLKEVISVWSVTLITDWSSDLVIGFSGRIWPGIGPHAFSGGGGIGAEEEVGGGVVVAAGAAAGWRFGWRDESVSRANFMCWHRESLAA